MNTKSKKSNNKATSNPQKNLFEKIYVSALEGILIANADGTIFVVNPALEKMFGYAKGELPGKKVETLIPSRLGKQHTQHRQAYQKKPVKRSMGKGLNLVGKRANGSEFPVEISLNYIKGPEGITVFAHIMDISMRKRIEEELQDLNKELESKVEERTKDLENAILEMQKSNKDLESEVSKRMKAEAKTNEALQKERELGELKSRFVTMASHEFRTPLSTILSSNSLLAKYIGSAQLDKQEKHIDRIKGAVKNMIEILNDFLSLDKLEEGWVEARPERLDLEELLTELIEETRLNLEPDQVIERKKQGKDSTLVSDRSMLRHIIENLLSNAIKYSPQTKGIYLNVAYKASKVIISITDEGMGIPEADQKHLFERFFRAKNAVNIKGTGLGLNIVKKYVELLGGKISFHSELGSGTTFEVEIPRKYKQQ